MRRVVFDLETDGFSPTVIWCLCAYDYSTDKTYSFVRPDKASRSAFLEFAAGVDEWVAHNGIEFDQPVVERLIGSNVIPSSKVIDTLIMSRMYDYERPDGHSLEALGVSMGIPKGDFKDFSKFSLEMLAYCKQDVQVTKAVFDKFWPKFEGFKESIKVEGAVQGLLRRMHENGFEYDFEAAAKIEKKATETVALLDAEILAEYRPRSKVVDATDPKVTSTGEVHKGSIRWYLGNPEDFNGGSYCRLTWEVFNPGSVKQVVEKLNEARWKPYEKTKTHIEVERSRPKTPKESLDRKERLKHFKVYGWKVNEANIATLPKDAPKAATLLVKRMLHASRIRTLTEWKEAYNEKDGRIHGVCQGLGTWTQRASHRNPNTANIAAPKSIKYSSPELSSLAVEYGRNMRSLWCAGNGKLLVGTDAEGIQLRVLAHYLGDKGYADAIVEGDKELGTDVHSVNRRTLGNVCRSRDTAKTFIYALLLGAGDGKIADILGCSLSEARSAKERFIAATPGFAKLKNEVIPRDAARGYFVGFDGRRVRCSSEHLMLAGYLQNGEALVMKYAMIHWHKELTKLGIWYTLANFVHDEWQTVVMDNTAIAQKVGEVQAASIKWAGEYLGVTCPLAGAFKIGRNWYETH